MLGYYDKELQNVIHLMIGEDYDDLLENLGNIFEKKIAPLAQSIDAKKEIPKSVYTLLADQGFFGIAGDETYGGLGLPYPVYIAALEMLSRAEASIAISVAIHGTATSGIEQFGSDQQKKMFLQGLFSGKMLAAYGLTEPNSGSDAGAMNTKATSTKQGWTLNGSKTFITNAQTADLYFVFAKTLKGASAFLVPKNTKGFSVGKTIEKMGFKGSHTGELIFQNAFVPSENLVGEEGNGFDFGKHMLNGGRITIAALSVGIAEAAFQKALTYSKERKQFGKAISEFQMIQDKLATMRTKINAARMMVYKAAMLRHKKEFYAPEASQAKLFAGEMCVNVCEEAIQIHGGYGYADEYDVHRHWRDSKLMTIGEGTSEVQKMVISKFLLKGK